jgi:glutamyl-tRNA reductase
VLVLSTCSRTELHGVRAEGAADPEELLALLTRGDGLLRHAVSDAATVRQGDTAVEHLFRVAAGLESRVAGEVEIQAQLRAAARAALASAGEPHRLRDLVRTAVASARSGPATALEARQGLLARCAVQRALAAAPARELEVLVVGAGTMGHQVHRALPAPRCRTTMLSRCPSAATAARPEVHSIEELPTRLGEADLVFVATSAGRHLLTREVVGKAAAGRPHPVTLVDLSVPRNVDPDVSQEAQVRLLDLDDLDAGHLSRPDPPELLAAEVAARESAQAYLDRLRVRRAGPLISTLRANLEEVCLAKLRAGLRGSAVPEDVIAEVAASVAGTVAHPPTMLLRAAAGAGDEPWLDKVAACYALPAPGEAGGSRG